MSNYRDYQAKVIAHSKSPEGHEVVTFNLSYWRAIHAELMTHKAPSRNASSSRAIPVQRMLKMVWSDPARPIYWGSNRPGMQAGEELTGWRRLVARMLWRSAAVSAVAHSWGLMKVGLHKQVANRVTEPYQRINVVFTVQRACLEDIFALRDHPSAQPEFRVLAQEMKAALSISIPRQLRHGEWHLPFVHPGADRGLELPQQLAASAARCARVSYMNHDGSTPDIRKDVELHDSLKGSVPPHMSPFEHQLKCMPLYLVESKNQYANFYGFMPYRTMMERDFSPV